MNARRIGRLGTGKRCGSTLVVWALFGLLGGCKEDGDAPATADAATGSEEPTRVDAATDAGTSPASDAAPPTTDAGSAPPGALVLVTTVSTVGVLLDELPESVRERVAAALLDKPDSFFIERAKRQLALATYRLNFRNYFYDEEEGKKQLPLPQESVFDLRLIPDEDGVTLRRAQVEGHDYVLADYELSTVVVTDGVSPAVSEPALSVVGGVWEEPFTFPVDPELLVQRTGYACMDEAEFPPNSVDTENAEFFYDQDCEVEDTLTPDGCHYTELPDQSCQDALSTHVGKVDTALRFERLAWDEQTAERYRVGEVLAQGVADLEVVTEELAVNRLIYRYIGADSCALAEECVGGTGWRRLLMFNASEKNTGSEPIHIGEVDYYLDDPDNPTANADHHVYQYSECHEHFHFNYFAEFTYGGDPELGSKRAFCLESVARYGNHEQSPMWSAYNDCGYQGISQGWGDQYNAGIECQWVDVTSVDTSDGPVTMPLGLRSNPEGFLCEGTPVLDSAGNPTWEMTDLRTEDGQIVDRPVCEEISGWDDNNYGELDVTLPVPGEGMVTAPCTRGQLGPKRNCGFTYAGEVLECEPGSAVRLTCTTAGDAPQVVRVCEGSHALGPGLACLEADSLDLGQVLAGQELALTFTCPDERDAEEPGGLYALYFAPTWTEDAEAPVTCVAR
jgi:hypothetical protein